MPTKQGKNGIGYLTHTWTPVKGRCPYRCYYCYMDDFFKRFKWDETLRLDDKEFKWSPKDPSRIGVCFNLDLFHPQVSRFWIDKIVDHIWKESQHNFLFLTKNPHRYHNFTFPKNAWLGTTWDGLALTERNPQVLDQRFEASFPLIKFLSLEPLTRKPDFRLKDLKTINWIILGLDSRRGIEKIPQDLTEWWARDIIAEARDLDIAVWVKKNYRFPEVIQEIPERVIDFKPLIPQYIP